MPLDFSLLCPQIERVIDLVGQRYRNAPGTILTEEDLRCELVHALRRLPGLRRYLPTQDRHIRATSVHAQLSWFGNDRRLSIVPDITIVEPAHLSILHGYEPV